MPDDPQTPAMKLDLAVLRSQQLIEPDTVERSANGGLRMDEAAFRTFYGQTARPLLGYLIHTCGDRDLAEDLWQESYTRFLTANVPEMDERRARSYLFQIAANLMRDRWRRRDEEPLSDGILAAASRDPRLDLRLGMRQAFRRLKPRERQLLWLAYVEGSNHREIANSTGLRSGSVRLLLFRARRKLAKLIGASSPGPNSEARNPEVNR
jgi:RNA polymerase sigma-70 factor (ECF subfamily)